VKSITNPNVNISLVTQDITYTTWGGAQPPSMKAIRHHWSIENGLHWALDVSFHEDDQRKRAGNAAQNFSIVNRIALTALKQDKLVKLGIKSKRLNAGWNHNYLGALLKF